MNLLLFFLIHFPFGCEGVFWRRRWHSSIIARDWLYIDGGEIASTKGNYVAQNSTIGIDLSKDWTNTSLTPIQIEKPSELIVLGSEALWFDDKKNIVYSFGGDNYNDYDTVFDSIRGFTPDTEGSGKWKEVVGLNSTIPFPSDIHCPSAGTFTSDGNEAYYLGGFISSATTSEGPYHSFNNTGLLRFNFESLKITNSSGPDLLLDYGAFVNVPIYGSGGVLLAFGGINNQKYSNGIPFNTIQVFDKKKGKWYSQVAAGEIPRPRNWFCAVGVHGKERTSFEIIIHGGMINRALGPDSEKAAEVYVLSLPAFRWFRANYTSDSSRAGHTCHATKTRQMIMIGGVSPFYSNQTLNDDVSQDPWSQGIAVFDMTALKLQDSYRSKTDLYEPPPAVQQYYSNSTSKYPPYWTSPEVKAIFEDKPRSRLGRGALAGLIVGCIVGVLLFGVIIYTYMMKKRRSRNEKNTELSAVGESTLHDGSDDSYDHEMSNQPYDHEMSNQPYHHELST